MLTLLYSGISFLHIRFMCFFSFFIIIIMETFYLFKLRKFLKDFTLNVLKMKNLYQISNMIKMMGDNKYPADRYKFSICLIQTKFPSR